MKKEYSLIGRIFKILRIENGLAESMYVSSRDEFIWMKVQEQGERMRTLFELNMKEKILDFLEEPKSSIMEKECMEFAQYLEDKKYEIKGLNSFIKNPRFKQPKDSSIIEFSLY